MSNFNTAMKAVMAVLGAVIVAVAFATAVTGFVASLTVVMLALGANTISVGAVVVTAMVAIIPVSHSVWVRIEAILEKIWA